MSSEHDLTEFRIYEAEKLKYNKRFYYRYLYKNSYTLDLSYKSL